MSVIVLLWIDVVFGLMSNWLKEFTKWLDKWLGVKDPF